MVPELLVLALAFHRAPIRFAHLTDPAQPLPDPFADWLIASCAALGPTRIQSTAEALDTGPEALREAFLFLLRQVLLTSKADYYRVLGLPRGCAAERIKHHHSLLVQMFHPDRLGANDARGVALTARINVAYQILRDPEARRRYDSHLPPLREGVGGAEGALAFFRPQEPVRPNPASTRDVPIRIRPGVLWVAASIVVAGLVLLVAGQPRQPLLQVNPELADGSAFGPAYLQGGKAEREATAGPGHRTPRAVAAPSDPGRMPIAQPAGRAQATDVPQIPRHTRPVGASALSEAAGDAGITARGERPWPPGVASPAASRPEPPLQTRKAQRTETPSVRPKPQTSPEPTASSRRQQDPLATGRATSEAPAPGIRQPPRAAPAQTPDPARVTVPRSDAAVYGLLSRLEGSFAKGDLAGVVSLFSANAVFNNAVGSAAIRKAYADIFAQAGQRRMTISSLTWRKAQDQRLVGRGTIRIGTRSGSQQAWSSTAGTLEIELVPWMGDHKISRLIHYLSSN
jgi:hypothetical protein